MSRWSLSLLLCVAALPLACGADEGSGGGGGDDGGDDGGATLAPGQGSSDGGTTIDQLKQQPPTDNCGDGKLDDDEACDDGNTQADDGCHSNCRLVEPGFICADPGEACRRFANCGDGAIQFPEQCDDENEEAGDGCSASCKLEIGYKCSGEPSDCSTTTCGDDLVEGAEGCDDGNDRPFDGCDERCQWEPTCGSPGSTSGCTVRCGDGIVMGQEECDDGNVTSGDGCSESCQVEADAGYSCEQAPCDEVDGQCVLKVAAVFRDFTDSHPDFELDCSGLQTGAVENSLSGGKPKLASGQKWKLCAQGTSSFAEWYQDVPGKNSTTVSELVLFPNGSGGFVNRFGQDGNKYKGLDGNPLFFPMNDYPDCAGGERVDCALPDMRRKATIPEPVYGGGWQEAPGNHNFHFTTELTYWFEHDEDSPAKLEFVGDDDVWVFINGKLAVDLGGVHGPEPGSVTLNSATNGSLGLGLEDGVVYPISVFHAERHVTASSFKLTLSGFDVSRSECSSTCGDGIVAGDEECDDGVNDGGYNECQPGCELGGFCGDGIVQEGEQCDDADASPGAPDCSGCRPVVVR